MRTLLLVSFFTLSGFSAHTAQPRTETAQVVKAFLHNPAVVRQLSAAGTTNLQDVEISEIRTGIFHYKLVLDRVCKCTPRTATVTIDEDLTPTFFDGAPTYKSNILFNPPL